jgi:dihydrofolate reductase
MLAAGEQTPMKTILWAILSANGNYAQRYPSKEALDDFAAHVRRSGNFITGRKTFELIQANENRGPGNTPHAFTKTDIVVLSKRGGSIPGVTVIRSPQEALKYLSAKGHQTALIAGGEKTHNAFLAENLVDEFVFNIAPTLESEGLKIFLPKDSFMEINLLTSSELGSGLVQLHYAIQGDGGDGANRTP